MRRNFICILVLFTISVNTINAQNNKKEETELANYRVRIFPDAFLAGTFSDYLGRFRFIDKETQIDRYYPKEKSLGKYISFFILNNYKVKNELVVKEDQSSELYIPNIAERLNTTFYYENGEIAIEKFVTEEEKLSFLLGVYYRYGELIEDNFYQIKLVNSAKTNIFFNLLKDLQSDEIIFKTTTNQIPKTTTFYFSATPKMIKYFDYLKQEKAQLEFESIDFIDENKKFEDTSKQKEKNKKELIKSLKTIFSK